MPNPKRRHSNTRTRKRRTHDVMKAMHAAKDPHCGLPSCGPRISHRVCPNCGYYNGRQVLQIKPKNKKKK